MRKFLFVLIGLLFLNAHSFSCESDNCEFEFPPNLEFAPTYDGPPQERISSNLYKAMQLHTGGHTESAIEFLNKIVYSTLAAPIEKVHYLVALSTFHLSYGNLEGYEKDMEKLKHLCLNDPACNAEFWNNYECSFLCYPKED